MLMREIVQTVYSCHIEQEWDIQTQVLKAVVLVKLIIAMDKIQQKFPAVKIGLCYIPSRKGNKN